MKSSALKKLTAAVASALLLTSAVHAAGLGKLTVLSALGQPLRAEIELTSAANEDAAGVVVKLASPDAFKNANIDFNPALLTLRFTVEERGGRQVIRVSSSQPLNEPFVDMLLELTWSSGHLVREYTFLLDPSELRKPQSAQVASAAAPARRQRADAAAASAPAEPAADAERPRRNRARPADSQPAETAPAEGSRGAASGSYRVKAGDNLGRIAGQLKPADVSLDMMLVALYRANPDAFVGNNMNRLKSGRVLSVPDEGAVRATGGDAAHEVVVAHAADFNAYRNKLAGQVATAEPTKVPQGSQSAAGKITAKVEERPTAVNESPDRLRLSKAAPSAAAGKASAAEDVIAKQKELAEAQARLKELERNVTDLQKIATIKNKAAADAEQKASAPMPPAAVAAAAAPAKPGATPAVAAAPAKPAAAPAAAAPAAPGATPAPVALVPKKLPAIKPVIKPASQEPSLFDKIMDNLLPIGGVALLALLGGALALQRRKKRDADLAGPVSILNVPSEPTHSLFAQTGGQSVDTTNNSVFNSNFAPSASQLDTNEVDPVAEADVYIAYGRDAQAEEILKEALRVHPERLQVRLKLLEIYAARKDQPAFESQATEMYNLTRGQGDEWAQAASLGLSIDPQNPLYATSGATTLAPFPSDAHDMLSKDMDDAFGAAAREPAGFDQHFAGALEAQNAVAAAPAPDAAGPATKPNPAAQEDEHLLDFDLGGLSFEPATDDAHAVKSGGAHDGTDQVSDLDFDMDAFAAPTAESTALPAAEAHADNDPHDLTFDMDAFAAAPPVPAAVEPEKAEEFPFDMDFDTPPAATSAAAPDHNVNLADLAREFDLPPLPETRVDTPAAPDHPSLELDTLDFGAEMPASKAPEAFDVPPAHDHDHALDLADLEAGPQTRQRAPSPNFTPANKYAPRFDFSNVDHDLSAGPSTRLPEISAPAFDVDHGSSDVATVDLSPAHMEMETKLDLAMAYQEIGDKEGARELLEEVIKGGNVEQASRANAIRSALV
jgi:pilus assembly protein FimV